jgi:hypothetical protein
MFDCHGFQTSTMTSTSPMTITDRKIVNNLKPKGNLRLVAVGISALVCVSVCIINAYPYVDNNKPQIECKVNGRIEIIQQWQADCLISINFVCGYSLIRAKADC